MKYRDGMVTVLVCALLFFPAISSAATHWEPAGFGGGGFFPQITVDPTDSRIVYLGADVSGLTKSIDYGNTWSKINSGLGSTEIASLAIDPSNHLRLWAGTPLGLYSTTNGGQSWSLASANIHCFKHVNYRGVTISQDGETILVASHDVNGDPESGDFSGKLYRSSNGGATWTVIQQFPGTRIPSVMLDPYSPNEAFLLVDREGMRKSTDGGVHWQNFSTGLPSNLTWKNMDIGRSVIYITAVPTKPYKSSKDSASWQSIRSNIPEDYEDTSYPVAGAIRVSPADDNLVYLGQAGWPSVLFRSLNGGQTWVGSLVPDDYAFDFTNAPFQTWNDPFQGPVSIAIDPQNPARLYYTTWWGAWRSEDGGATWVEKVVGAQNTCCTDVEFTNNTLISSHMDVGIFRSLDLGGTWLPGYPNAQASGPFEQHGWSLETGADGKIYASLSTSTGPKVYRSDDQGVTWQKKSGGLPTDGSLGMTMHSLAKDPNNPGTIYLGVESLLTNGLFRTTNYGDIWTQLLHAPGSGASTANRLIKCIEVDPTNSNRVLAGLYWDGLWYSEDGGETWNRAHGNGVNLDSASVQMVVALPDGTVFAAYDDGIYKSTDHGHTFTRMFPALSNLGESTLEYAYSLTFNPADHNKIFASTAKVYPVSYNQGSVWHTSDGGTTWTDITGDLPVTNVVDLAFHEGYLYAATWCANVYRARVSPTNPALNVGKIETSLNAPPEGGSPITFTFSSQGHGSQTYYKFWLASGYQTSHYGNWQVLKDWSTSNIITWTPSSDDHYVIVAYAAEEPNGTAFHQAGLSLETQNHSAHPIQITALITDMGYPQPSGRPISLTTTATGGNGPLSYRYWSRRGEGVWTMIRDYSSSNSCTWTPSEDGVYTIVVWVTDDTTLSEPPIAGMTCTIGRREERALWFQEEK